MGKRLNSLTRINEEADGFRRALSHINEVTSKRMMNTATVQATPSRRGTTSAPSLAFTPMVKLRPSRALDLPPALQDALRHVGVPFNQDSLEALQDSLSHVQVERTKKLVEHYETAAMTSHDRLAERSSTADVELRTVLDAVYKHTSYRQVQLADAALEAQLKSLEREIEGRSQDVLEAENNELNLNDPKVRVFIAKYGK